MSNIVWSDNSPDYGFWRAELAFTSESDPIYINSGAMNISVALHPSGGASARIEYTLSSRDKVAANTAKWLPWTIGTSTESKADRLQSTVTAIKGISSGSATIEVIGS